MTRILHLSDLHFGLERKPLVEPLIDRINAARADLVVVTGDLTHRGRSAQFAQAAAFLRRIEAPLLAVPGNHDIPLYKLADRMMRPWRRWRRAIAENLEPVGHVGNLRVQGINSVDPMSWQRGIVTPAQVARVIAGLDLAALAFRLMRLAQRGMLQAPSSAGLRVVHVSGCAKACAYPQSATINVMGRAGAFDLGWQTASPLHVGLSADAVVSHLECC